MTIHNRERLDSWTFIWDVDTLDWIPWTGAVSGVSGGPGGGTVDQGAAGLDPWLVSIDGVPHVVIDSASLGTVAISAAALPLPSGASTGAKQDTQQTALDAIKAKTDNIDVALSAAAATLPTGAATAARQDTGNTSVASIDTKTPALGQALAAASTPVVLPAAQIVTLTPPAAITGYGLEATQLLQATAAKQDTEITGLASILSELGGKTEPADQQHVIVDTMPPVSAATSADVVESDDDAGYESGETGQNLTQTPDGRLRTAVAALVSDGRQSYQDGDVRSLSITTDGRLRVATSESYAYLEMFRSDDLFFNVPMLAQDGPMMDVPNNPWGF